MQPLARQGGRDPRLEDGRIDGLGQVVGGTHLDAAHDAVELVDAGDHDDRQVPQRRVVAERREHRIAVHLGHDDVEEDHVDRGSARVAQPLERLDSVPDLDRLVSDAPQEPRQELAVELGVIDDEDPAGPDRAITGGWGHAGPPAVAAEPARASAASSSSGRMGLLT
jgi:hypothetical protein